MDSALETPSRTIGAVAASMEDGVGAGVGDGDGCRAIKVDPADSWLRGPDGDQRNRKKKEVNRKK